jgi:hypothetical protein
MRVIQAKPGDQAIIVRLIEGARERVFELVFGRKGKLSAQLQEIKPPLRATVLQQIKRT